MKTIPVALLDHYQQTTTTLCAFLKVTRTDSVVVGLTTADREIVIAGVTYSPGLSLSTLASTDTLSVDNLELTLLDTDPDVLRAEIIAGRWDNAAFEIFQASSDPDGSPFEGLDILKRGTTGEATLKRGQFVLEFRGLSQALQQTQGAVTSKTCRARFADYPAQFGSFRCGLNSADFIETGTLTGVASSRQVTDSGRAEAAGYFSEGLLMITSGDAAGYTQKIKKHSSGGVFLLSLPLPFTPAIGDTYSVIAGCLKTREACKAHGNILNMQAEPDLQGIDKATGKGTATNPQPGATPEYATDSQEFPGGGP